jgi:hypothetical protein
MNRRLIKPVTACVATGAVIAVGAAVAIGATSKGKADTATAYVAITHTVGKTQFAAGNVTDKVLGAGAITFKITVGVGTKPGTLKVIANPVTLFTKTGALSGTGTASITVNSNGSATFTGGKLKLTKGGGAQKGHSFIGTFTGTAASPTGPYVFHEKGTYK